MSKRWSRCFTIIILVLSFALAGGCITIVDDQPQKPDDSSPVLARPVVSSFTATPDSITEGQQSKLAWEVSGATGVTISPIVGSVAPVNTALVTPTDTTTYTLTATNEAGSTTSTVTVTVAEAVAGQPDLQVTKVWLQGRSVYYTIVNNGSGKAPVSRAYLYVNGHKDAEDYVEAMEVGEERTENFSNYNYPYDLEATGVELKNAPTYIVKVCADEEHAVVESNEDNNCGSVILGQLFVYDFVENAHRVEWKTNSGTIIYPSPQTSTSGAAFTRNMSLEDDKGYGSCLATFPPPIDQGWIEGSFGDFYTDQATRQSMSRDIVVPENAKFIAKVGFKKGASDTDGVWFLFGYTDEMGRVNYAPGVFASYDGKLSTYQVDLSQIAGKKTRFLLRVEDKAGDLYKENWAVWQNPIVTQAP